MSEGFFMVSLWYMRGRGGSIWPVGAIFFIPPRLSTILTDEFSVLRRILKLNKIKVRICIGTNCCFHGSEMLVDALENDADPGPLVELEEVRCFDKLCQGGINSPVVEVNGKLIVQATLEGLMEEIELSAADLRAGVTAIEGHESEPADSSPRQEAPHA
jgi:hypothetical protein